MTPRRIQLSRRKGYRKPEGAVVVARPTKWGNPFRVRPGKTQAQAVADFARAVATHGAWVVDIGRGGRRLWAPVFAGDLKAELRGRDLVCWCKLCEQHRDGKPLGVECAECAPCHADVLLEVSNGGPP